ncbi:MAG: hypothetical protein J6Y16_11415 [Treponema sp.]|nr:hypothetical protein [Treponema sp.]
MKELIVIIDVSGSMYAMGKTSVVGNVLSTLSALEVFGDENSNFFLTKMQWDGTSRVLEALAEKSAGKNTLILTDGYALSDNCKASKIIKKFFEENCDNLFVLLCGGDCMNISALKEFRRVHTLCADNVLYALECFGQIKNSSESKDDEGEEGWK